MVVIYFFFVSGGVDQHSAFLPIASYAQLPIDTIVRVGRQLISGEDLNENSLNPLFGVIDFPGAMPLLGFDDFLWLRTYFVLSLEKSGTDVSRVYQLQRDFYDNRASVAPSRDSLCR